LVCIGQKKRQHPLECCRFFRLIKSYFDKDLETFQSYSQGVVMVSLSNYSKPQKRPHDLARQMRDPSCRMDGTFCHAEALFCHTEINFYHQ
jgi:hypothetical protein